MGCDLYRVLFLRLAPSCHLCPSFPVVGHSGSLSLFVPQVPSSGAVCLITFLRIRLCWINESSPYCLRETSPLLSAISNIPCHSSSQPYANNGHFFCPCQNKNWWYCQIEALTKQSCGKEDTFCTKFFLLVSKKTQPNQCFVSIYRIIFI